MVVAIAVTACSGGTTPKATPEPPAFDLGAVKANFTDECADPIIVDDLFCEQVTIASMTAEGTILRVPTTLNAAARDRASVICQQLATAHFDGTGKDLGYDTIGVLDKDGGNAAACSVA
jgi:hypothetical protein